MGARRDGRSLAEPSYAPAVNLSPAAAKVGSGAKATSLSPKCALFPQLMKIKPCFATTVHGTSDLCSGVAKSLQRRPMHSIPRENTYFLTISAVTVPPGEASMHTRELEPPQPDITGTAVPSMSMPAISPRTFLGTAVGTPFAAQSVRPSAASAVISELQVNAAPLLHFSCVAAPRPLSINISPVFFFLLKLTLACLGNTFQKQISRKDLTVPLGSLSYTSLVGAAICGTNRHRLGTFFFFFPQT